MSAQLSIDTIYQPRYNRYSPKINHWADKRDELEKAGKLETAAAAQRQVEAYCDKMHEQGCFGDNYQHNLLNQFGLCWHRDIYDELLDERDTMQPEEAQKFLQLLGEREQIFEHKLRKVKRVENMSRAETVQYFRDKYARLTALLQESIASNEPITLSL